LVKFVQEGFNPFTEELALALTSTSEEVLARFKFMENSLCFYDHEFCVAECL